MPDLAWHKPAPASRRTRAFTFVGPVTQHLCTVEFGLHLLKNKRQGEGI